MTDAHPMDGLDADAFLRDLRALRSLHEPQIIDAKIAAAQRLVETLPAGGGRLELTEDDANAWIAAINDIRLALGTILGVGPDASREEIQAAYARLIRAVHPDAGGTSGLAARLNAARDTLLKK